MGQDERSLQANRINEERRYQELNWAKNTRIIPNQGKLIHYIYYSISLYQIKSRQSSISLAFLAFPEALHGTTSRLFHTYQDHLKVLGEAKKGPFLHVGSREGANLPDAKS